MAAQVDLIVEGELITQEGELVTVARLVVRKNRN